MYAKIVRALSTFTSSGAITLHARERLARIRAYGIDTDSSKLTVGIYQVDRNHENGDEIHVLLRNAIVLVFNLRTRKLVTALALRPKQLEKYLEFVGNSEIRAQLIAGAQSNVQRNMHNL